MDLTPFQVYQLIAILQASRNTLQIAWIDELIGDLTVSVETAKAEKIYTELTIYINRKDSKDAS